jgi:hypothetical protein
MSDAKGVDTNQNPLTGANALPKPRHRTTGGRHAGMLVAQQREG